MIDKNEIEKIALEYAEQKFARCLGPGLDDAIESAARHAAKGIEYFLRSRANEFKGPQWVSVDERLPEDGQVVLACKADGDDLEVWTFHKEYDFEKNCFENCSCTPQFMDYWMPIPAVPQLNPQKEER